MKQFVIRHLLTFLKEKGKKTSSFYYDYYILLLYLM